MIDKKVGNCLQRFLLLHRGHLESQEMTEICLSVDDVGDVQKGMGTGKMSDLGRGRQNKAGSVAW